MRDPSATDSQVTAAVLTELFFFSTAHGNIEIYITVSHTLRIQTFVESETIESKIEERCKF